MPANIHVFTSDRPFHLFVWLSVVGAALCLLLLAVRFYYAISFVEPMQVHTTGDEFSQFYAVWRQIQGLPVYTDRFSPPYYYAIYNFLFYHSYGLVTGFVLDLFSLKDAWVPTIARLISLASMFVGIVACYVCYLKACSSENGRFKTLSLAFAVFILAGPLIGYWNITVRSDLWARTLDIVGITLFIFHYPKDRWRAIIWICVFGYLAWAFKQGSVFSVGAVGLFLLVRRDWAPLCILSVALPAAWGITIFFGDPQYVYNFLLKDITVFFSFDRLVRNLLNFSVKMGPVLFFLGALVFVVVSTRNRMRLFWQSDIFALGCSGALCASVISIPGSSQLGGAENYFFTLSFFLGLMVCASLPILNEIGEQVWVKSIVAGNIGWVTLIIAIGLVLSGDTGVINLRSQHATYMSGKACLDTLARPLFVNNPYLSLPWISPNTENFVLSYTYLDDKNAGKAFKFGGVGGLISEGRFNMLAIQKGSEVPPHQVDGGDLRKYKLVDTSTSIHKPCKKFFIFRRN
jgi:hypothetical protein